MRGQWRAHGRYLERESALSETLGFDSKDSGVPISSRLESWQAQNDELLWKFIISPEFGDRADLQRLTRDLMGGAEEDLGRPLEWVAAIHQNTEYPHVHVALRGVSADGNVLRLSRDYIKSGIREIAEDLCTRQLGYRTTLDASEAECREISQARYTSLDRFIFRHARASDTDLVFNPTRVNDIERNQRISARLVTLSRMGLAERTGDGSWSLRHDTEQVLRSMQRAKDRQKTLSVHGALLSDERLPIEAIDWRHPPASTELQAPAIVTQYKQSCHPCNSNERRLGCRLIGKHHSFFATTAASRNRFIRGKGGASTSVPSQPRDHPQHLARTVDDELG